MFDLRLWLLNIACEIEIIPWIYGFSIAGSFIFFTFCATAPFFVEYNPSSNRKGIASLQKITLSNFMFIISVVVLIATARWPSLLPSMMNVDEGWFLAAAMKLLKNPLFWESVDGGSTGPLNIYPLMLPAILGLKIEYATARLIGSFFITASIILLYCSLIEIYSRKVARIALVPVVMNVSLTTFSDHVNYISELCPIFLLSCGLYLVCKYYSCRLLNSNKLLFVLGFVLGLTPYAKLQSVPVAIAIAAIFVHMLFSRRKSRKNVVLHMFFFGLGASSPSVFTMAILSLFSIHDSFWKSYIQQNFLFYSSNPHSAYQKLMLFIDMMQESTLRDSDQTLFLYAITLVVSLSGIPYLLGKRSYLNQESKERLQSIQSDTFVFLLYASIFLASSCYAIGKPGNPFGHYLLFLIIPSGFLIGVFLGESKKIMENRELVASLRASVFTIVSIIIFVSSFLQVSGYLKSGNVYLNQRMEYLQNYTDPVVAAISRYASPGEQMALWGWSSELYVDSGLVQATRDGTSLWQIFSSPLQHYYIKRYLDDFVASNPPLFIDTVAPGRFKFTDRATQSHEAFPEVNKFISENYQIADEVNGVRIYTRK
jgi:hypothetical protein